MPPKMFENNHSWSAVKVETFQEEMSSTKTASETLDNILLQIGQKFGKFQVKNYVFICFPIIFTAFFTISYIFTAKNLDYRCHIQECDPPEPSYNPVWLKNAVPLMRSNAPSRCYRYPPLSNNNVTSPNPTCSVTLFNRSITQKCNEYVFDTDQVTILNDFDLVCEQNLWKLTLVGTVNNIGQFVCMPIAGFISDRYGRRSIMLGGLLLSSLIGLLRSFSPSYLWFLLFEFLDTALGSGAYSSGFILGVELVTPDKRVLSGSLISSSFAIGEAILGITAWHVKSWRSMLRYLYLPGFILIIFFWLTPESIRWLLTKGRYNDVKNNLRKAARLNNIILSEEELASLEYRSQLAKEEVKTDPMKKMLSSSILMLRIFNCSFCWVTCNFVYYGLSLNSVAVAGNIYLNFISVSLIEIPGYFTTYLIVDRFGRRVSLCGSLLLSGMACLSFIFLPEDAVWLKLSVFLVGKFGITVAFTVLYVFTTELFPTSLRQSSLGTCSMFGRIGSMVAPQTPLLAEIMESLPLILFGGMSVASGLLVLLFPETLNTKLPDTIEEAELIGRKQTEGTAL